MASSTNWSLILDKNPPKTLKTSEGIYGRMIQERFNMTKVDKSDNKWFDLNEEDLALVGITKNVKLSLKFHFNGGANYNIDNKKISIKLSYPYVEGKNKIAETDITFFNATSLHKQTWKQIWKSFLEQIIALSGIFGVDEAEETKPEIKYTTEPSITPAKEQKALQITVDNPYTPDVIDEIATELIVSLYQNKTPNFSEIKTQIQKTVKNDEIFKQIISAIVENVVSRELNPVIKEKIMFGLTGKKVEPPQKSTKMVASDAEDEDDDEEEEEDEDDDEEEDKDEDDDEEEDEDEDEDLYKRIPLPDEEEGELDYEDEDDRRERQNAESRKQREVYLKSIIPKDKIRDVFRTLEQIFQDEGGQVMVFDEENNVLLRADTYDDAIDGLVRILQEEMTTGIKKARYLGNPDPKFTIISLAEHEMMPALQGEVYQLMNGLDLQKQGERQIFYDLQTLMTRGIKSSDITDLSRQLLNIRMNDKQGLIQNEITNKMNTKRYSLKKLKKYNRWFKKHTM